MRASRLVIVCICMAALLLVYLTAASQAPWPVEGAAGFVWGAGLVAVAVGYVLRRRPKLSSHQLAWGLVLAITAFFIPIILNQLVDSDYLHRLHKLLSFVIAFFVFMVWTAALKHRSRRRSSA